jgi:hypothetical protein
MVVQWIAGHGDGMARGSTTTVLQPRALERATERAGFDPAPDAPDARMAAALVARRRRQRPAARSGVPPSALAGAAWRWRAGPR